MENKRLTLKTEVAIVGAGLVGLAAAIALHQVGHAVVLVDSKNPHLAIALQETQADDAWDARIYAISPKNAQWLTRLGVWQQLNLARIGEMQGMALWGDTTTTPLNLSADEMHATGLGFIVEARALQQALLYKVAELGIHTLFEVECAALEATAQCAKLTLNSSTSGTTHLESTLLLAADGSHSWVRAQLDFHIKNKPYAHTAVVANFKAANPHQSIARQWFSVDAARELTILAWLPLPNDIISMVWSVPPAFAEDLLQLNAEDLAKKVAAAGQNLLGEFTLLNPVTAFPLALQTTDTPVQDCVILLGDAAHQVHPLAGQGVNVGFRDVADLLDVLRQKNGYQRLNDAQLLKHYARIRKADVAKLVLLTDGLFTLFNSQSNVVKKARHWGFEAAKQPYLKELLLNQAVNM